MANNEDCFEDSGIPVKLERLVDNKDGSTVMYLKTEAATGKYKGRSFSVCTSMGGDMLISFDQTKEEKKANSGGLSADRFIIRADRVVEEIAKHMEKSNEQS